MSAFWTVGLRRDNGVQAFVFNHKIASEYIYIHNLFSLFF